MFQKPVQHVTVETISKLGIEHVDSEIKKEIVRKEMSSNRTSPFSFSNVDQVLTTEVVKELKEADKEELTPTLQNGKVKRFRGDHILWIE